jgi:SulP family sulfate permease
VMVIGYSLFNRKQYRIVTRTTLSDAVVFWVTLLTGLVFALDFAIYVGVGASIILYLRQAAAPHLVEYGFTDEGQLQELAARQRTDMEISIVHVEGELFFGAADLFLEQTRRFCADPNLKVVILKMRNARHMDATSCMALEELVRYMHKSEQHILVCEVKSDIMRVLKKSGLRELIGSNNLFEDVSKNPTMSAAQAVRRAREIVGTNKMKVSIYVDSLKAKGEGTEKKSTNSE